MTQILNINLLNKCCRSAGSVKRRRLSGQVSAQTPYGERCSSLNDPTESTYNGIPFSSGGCCSSWKWEIEDGLDLFVKHYLACGNPSIRYRIWFWIDCSAHIFTYSRLKRSHSNGYDYHSLYVLSGLDKVKRSGFNRSSEVVEYWVVDRVSIWHLYI